MAKAAKSTPATYKQLGYSYKLICTRAWQDDAHVSKAIVAKIAQEAEITAQQASDLISALLECPSNAEITAAKRKKAAKK